MGEEGFLRRWARLKKESRDDAAPAPAASPIPATPAMPQQANAMPTAEGNAATVDGNAQPRQAGREGPTMQDVAQLHKDSDYAAFLAPGVDPSVRRLAMKKLFSDPHFNLMDGLDIYIGDYNQSAPMPAAMLASLRHAQTFFANAEAATATAGKDDVPQATSAAATATTALGGAGQQDSAPQAAVLDTNAGDTRASDELPPLAAAAREAAPPPPIEGSV